MYRFIVRQIVRRTYARVTREEYERLWSTRVAVHFQVRATLRDGSRYENEGMQLLHLRWGRIVEDYLFEETQKLAAALEIQGA